MAAFECHGVPYRLVTCPISWSEYLRLGLIMPQCRWSDGVITADSFEIIRELHRRYPKHQPVSLSDADQTQLERLFFRYVLGRAKGLRLISFMIAWSKMPSGRGASFASCVRGFMSIYFAILIIFGRRLARKRGADPDNYESLRRSLEKWSHRLGDKNFFAGETPGPLDFGLLGHIQCMVTGLTDEALPILRSCPALLKWLARMRKAMPAYDHDFTLRIVNQSAYPSRASLGDQLLFWLTFALALILFPVTAVGLTDAFRRRGQNPHRTGKRV